jgi:hypothetical protein
MSKKMSQSLKMTKLGCSHLHSGASADGTLLDGAFLSADAVAIAADDVLLQGQLSRRAVIQFF